MNFICIFVWALKFFSHRLIPVKGMGATQFYKCSFAGSGKIVDALIVQKKVLLAQRNLTDPLLNLILQYLLLNIFGANMPFCFSLKNCLHYHSFPCHWNVLPLLPYRPLSHIIWKLSLFTCRHSGFPGGSDGKESDYNVGNPSLILVLGRLPREGNGYSLQYSCLGNFVDRGA